jgi:predicted RNA-binding Zn-ribbon protein involved in translation (DUF1610 family)
MWRLSLLLSETAPLLGFAAAIAWVSLVTVEFYERIYRERIEHNEEELRRLGKNELSKLASDIETQLMKGAEVDARRLQERVDMIRSLLNARDELMSGRRKVFSLLLVLSITSVGATYAPEAVLWSAERSPTLIGVDYLVLAIVFVAGFWFLFRMFWFDDQILKISRAAKSFVRPTCKKCGAMMTLRESYEIGKWRCPECGQEIEYPIVRFVQVGSGPNPRDSSRVNQPSMDKANIA